MENTILIEVTNEKAVKLIHELEELHLIKILKETLSADPKRLSEKYRGSITKEQGASLNQHINQMRGEWDNI